LFGGGVYDGRFSVDPVRNANGIDRAFMLAAFHKNPEEILSVGLGTGSWIKIFSTHKSVKKITVVELNPGYADIIKNYPVQTSILNDPKISIEVCDGRKWLIQNPNKKFDVIFMNTTFHWRSNVTRVLSVEFFELVKSHLNENGVLYCNTTSSPMVAYTVADVFKYAVQYKTFVAAGETPFLLSPEERRNNLLNFEIAGHPWLDPSNPQMARVLSAYSKTGLSYMDKAIDRSLIITDDNMATEFRK
jgi:spermidine synthase